MKIQLVKDIVIVGSLKKAGLMLEVANNFGQELVNEGKAILPGQKIKTFKSKKHANNRNS